MDFLIFSWVWWIPSASILWPRYRIIDFLISHLSPLRWSPAYSNVFNTSGRLLLCYSRFLGFWGAYKSLKTLNVFPLIVQSKIGLHFVCLSATCDIICNEKLFHAVLVRRNVSRLNAEFSHTSEYWHISVGKKIFSLPDVPVWFNKYSWIPTT